MTMEIKIGLALFVWIGILFALIIVWTLLNAYEDAKTYKNNSCYDRSTYKCLNCGERSCKYHIIAEHNNETEHQK